MLPIYWLIGRALYNNTGTQYLADEPTLADGPPTIKNSCLEYCYTILGRQTHFGRWTPYQSRIDTLNTGTQYLADEPTLADGSPLGNRAEMP